MRWTRILLSRCKTQIPSKHPTDNPYEMGHNMLGPGDPLGFESAMEIMAVPHPWNSSDEPLNFSEEAQAAAKAAVESGSEDDPQRGPVRFELTLDQVSCSLSPPRSFLDQLFGPIDWKALFKTGRIKRVNARALEPVLQPLSAVIQSGSLVAIMGPSGCGKTTLLSILSGRTGMAHSGRVSLNGSPLTKEFDRFSSYVAQEDIFDGNERVIECLQFSYRLRTAVPSEWDSATRRERENDAMQHALSLLGLEGVQHSRVGSGSRRGISGGQKRRLTLGIGFETMDTLAMNFLVQLCSLLRRTLNFIMSSLRCKCNSGLMSDAKILLCDEPTTGLSAADAQLVVSALRRLSVECGMAVVAVVHQPSHAIMRCFDHLLLMCYDGRCAYNGRVDGALRYFSAIGFPCPLHQNPADFYLDLVSQSGKHAHEIANVYDVLMKPLVGARVRRAYESPPAEPEKPVEGMHLAGPVAQFCEVAKRSFRLWLRDHGTLAAIMGDSIVQGVVIGAVFFNIRNRASVYYQLSALFLMIVSLLASALWTVPLYVQQKVQYRTEVGDGYYSPVPYILATSMVANFFVSVGDFLLVTIMWLFFGFGFLPLLLCYLVGLLGFVVCDAVTAVCSLASGSFAEANASATLMFMLLMFVNGFTTNPASLANGIGWISYLSPFFLVFEALSISILETYDFTNDSSATSGNLPLRTAEEVYHTFGLAGRAYGHTGSPIQWLWAVDVVLLLVLMAISKLIVFVLQATTFLPKTFRSEKASRRFRRPSLVRWLSKIRRKRSE